jgi:hypothetical protein
MHRKSPIDIGLARLRDFVTAMMPGDEMSATQARQISGLSRARCSAMLDSLTRAGMTIRLRHEAYIRGVTFKP